MLLAGCEDEGADQMRGDLPRGLSGGRVSKEEDVFKLVVQFEKQPLRSEHSQELAGMRSVLKLDADLGTDCASSIWHQPFILLSFKTWFFKGTLGNLREP